MKLHLNEYSALLACSFVNGLVFTILFWVRAYQEERKSDLIFGFILLASCVYIMDWMLGFMGIHILFRDWLFIPYDIGLLITPLLFFYLKSQLDTTFQFSKRDFWHFLPYLIYVIYHLCIFSQGSAFTKQWSDNVHFPYHLADIEEIAIAISNFVYLFLSLRLYKYYRAWLPTQYANTEIISFAWYRNFLVVYALAIGVNWIYLFLERIGFQFSYVDIWWEKFLVGVIIYYVSIKGYTQKQSKSLIFKLSEIEENKAIEGDINGSSTAESAEEKGKTTTLEVEIPDFAIWKAKLRKAMDEEKLYLNPELSLSILAKHLQTNQSLLSTLINKGLGKNFNDYVNEYRVEEFKTQVQLPENEQFSFLGIAYDCGFNSKATFNRVFKKLTGFSPKEWKEQHITSF
jgi:AraC-like DNA-binding protein